MYRHTWTLAVEEQFYLIWPFLARSAGRRGLPILIVPMLILPVILRAFDVFPHLLVTRCDGLSLGALLAWILLDRERLERNRRAFALGFAVVAIVAISCPLWSRPLFSLARTARPAWAWHMIEPSLRTSQISLFYFGIVGFVVCRAGTQALSVLRRPRLVHAGQISYGLYLYHPFIFTAVVLIHNALGFRGSLQMDGLKLVACYVAASLSWRYVEQPILGLKSRFSYASPYPSCTPHPHLLLQASPPSARPTSQERWQLSERPDNTP
jgi:peptidoglycan/LPS O-acetylase OafA/YrhL